MLGDALLVFPGFFLEGMAAFAAGHLFYISAFGFKPVNPYAGAVLYSLGAAGEFQRPGHNHFDWRLLFYSDHLMRIQFVLRVPIMSADGADNSVGDL